VGKRGRFNEVVRGFFGEKGGPSKTQQKKLTSPCVHYLGNQREKFRGVPGVFGKREALKRWGEHNTTVWEKVEEGATTKRGNRGQRYLKNGAEGTELFSGRA